MNSSNTDTNAVESRLLNENATLNSEVSKLNTTVSTLTSSNITLKSINVSLQQRLERCDSKLPTPHSGTTTTTVVSSISVANYLPAMLLRLASAGEDFQSSTVHKHENSVLGFFDISGYTKLAESMGKEGAAGTERLSDSLSEYFEIAIKIITKSRWECD